jgi:hypothetical protein
MTKEKSNNAQSIYPCSELVGSIAQKHGTVVPGSGDGIIP